MMIRFWISLILLPVMTHATTIEVFKTSLMHMNDTGLNVKICNLDEYSALTESMSQSFDKSKEKIFSLKEIKTQLKVVNEAVKCQNDSLEYDIKKLPAIVFNKSQVVYGEFDIHAALSFLNHQGKK